MEGTVRRWVRSKDGHLVAGRQYIYSPEGFTGNTAEDQ